MPKPSTNIKIADITGILNLISVCFLFCVTPPGYSELFRIAVYCFISTYILDALVSKRVFKFRWKNTLLQWYFVIMIFFFLLQFIYYPFETNTQFFKQIAEDRLAFLGIGVVGLVGLSDKLNIKYILATCIAAATACCVFLLCRVLAETNGKFDANLLIWFRQYYFSSHMLFNFYLNTAIIFSIYLFNRCNKRWLQLTLFVIMCFLATNIMLSEGRIGLVSCSIMIIYFIIIRYYNKPAILCAAIVPFVVIATIFLSMNSKIKTEMITNEPRLQIWSMAASVAENHPMGMGASTAAANMKDCIIENIENGSFSDNAVMQAADEGSHYGCHAHNQFIQSFLEYGIFGVLALLAVVLMPPIISNYNARSYLIAFCLITFLQLNTDILVSGINPILVLLTITLLLHLIPEPSPDNSKVKETLPTAD